MKGKKSIFIGLAAALVLSLSIAGTALAAGNGKVAGLAGTSVTTQSVVPAQNGTPGTCADCDQDQLQKRIQDPTCDGTCDATCDGSGDQLQLHDGSAGGDQQRLRDASCN